MFKPATREKTKARVLLAGPSGSGKTRAALEIARGLGDRIAVIDTENRSASLYVGLNGLAFDVCELQPPYTYEKYLQAMRACFAAGCYDVLVVDSLTHVWHGEGGALDTVDQTNNKFAAWKDVTPSHNKLLSAISSSPLHILCTVRTKTHYALEEQDNRYGKKVQVPVKKGMAPMFREGVEYEFSVMLDINLDHEVTVSKTRITELDKAQFAPGELAVIGATMRTFHDTGALPKPASAPRHAPAQQQQRPTLPTKTTAKYPVMQFADVPFASLPHSALTAYVSYYAERLKTTEQANHKKAIQATLAAAEAELGRRQDAESAGADQETGELPDQEADQHSFPFDPSEDPAHEHSA